MHWPRRNPPPWYNSDMPSFPIKTPKRDYCAVVERGILARLAQYIPARSGRVFVVTTEDVWHHQGNKFVRGLSTIPHEVIHLPGGEDRKRLAHVESAAEEMLRRGADRSSVIIAFGGGIVNDMAGFLAAIFMRGIPVVQAPTTLLAQVDASIGGKTGVNLVEGKNMIGSFHQPLAVLIDPDVLATLPDREYRKEDGDGRRNCRAGHLQRRRHLRQRGQQDVGGERSRRRQRRKHGDFRTG